jgi:flagellar operon protein
VSAPLDGVTRTGAPAPVAPAAPARGAGRTGADFDGVLAQRLREAAGPSRTAPAEPVRWSAHARDRLAQRHIQVTPEVQASLEGAVSSLASKGSKESLVLVDRLAFVVSVPNRTVITAVERGQLREQVFTNIDSAYVS